MTYLNLEVLTSTYLLIQKSIELNNFKKLKLNQSVNTDSISEGKKTKNVPKKHAKYDNNTILSTQI